MACLWLRLLFLVGSYAVRNLERAVRSNCRKGQEGRVRSHSVDSPWQCHDNAMTMTGGTTGTGIQHSPCENCACAFFGQVPAKWKTASKMRIFMFCRHPTLQRFKGLDICYLVFKHVCLCFGKADPFCMWLSIVPETDVQLSSNIII